MVSAELEANSTPESGTTPLTENQAEIDQEVQNCQGYKVDPVSKFHLCKVCEYHK